MSSNYSFCAGVLPFTYFNQSVYFLLGKSKRNNRLITFSGKNDDLESDPLETAAREAYEETLGCLMSKNSILERIRKCDDSRILHSYTPRGMPCYTYVLEIPFRKHYSHSFHNTRDFINTMNIHSYAIQEMIDVKWVCEKSMFTKIRKTWEKYKILNIDSEWKKLALLCRSNVDTIYWRRDTNHEFIELQYKQNHGVCSTNDSTGDTKRSKQKNQIKEKINTNIVEANKQPDYDPLSGMDENSLVLSSSDTIMPENELNGSISASLSSCCKVRLPAL